MWNLSPFFKSLQFIVKTGESIVKEKVFIAWSGNPELASHVSSALSKHNYMGIVGGNQTTQPNSMYIGPSVISQMNTCSQAIFLITKKDIGKLGEGTISNNLLFELGYLVCRLPNAKIHLLYIDITENDPLIPSDIKGCWAKYLSSKDLSNDELASHITDSFLKAQTVIIPENKMDIIFNWYDYKQIIRTYLDSPQKSNFELAQYLLFYVQAVYFFEDYEESTNQLQKLKEQDHSFSYELQCSIDYALLTINFYNTIRTNMLTTDEFDTLIESYEYSLNKAEDFQNNEYLLWYKALHYENMGFAYYLFILSLTSDKNDDFESYINEMMVVCFEGLKYCRSLLSLRDNDVPSISRSRESPNYYFLTLIKSYIYRQIAIAYQIARQNNIILEEQYVAECEKAHEKSFKMRKILYNKYEKSRISDTVKSNIEMEYHIAMADSLPETARTSEHRRHINMLKQYIRKVQYRNKMNADIIETIEKDISRCQS